MSEELRRSLKPGDQIIATESARFPAHISPQGSLSQRKGDILMVNNPNIGNSVGGVGINDNGTSLVGRSRVGLGGSLKIGTFRRATIDDPGFLATREYWSANVRDAEIRRLHDEVFHLRAIIAMFIIITTANLFH